jgi:hypothetical protein
MLPTESGDRSDVLLYAAHTKAYAISMLPIYIIYACQAQISGFGKMVLHM